MKSLYSSLVVMGTVALLASPAAADKNINAKIFLHIAAPVTKNVCAQAPSDCRNAVVSAPAGNFYNVYVCVGNQDDSLGIAGSEFGIDYNGAPGQGVDIFSWNRCGDLDWASDGWPAPQTGNMVTWVKTYNCQYGPNTSVQGWFYLGAYTPDRLSIIPRPVSGRAKVANCEASETDLTDVVPSALGYADFGTGNGYNPCNGVVAVESTTWSAVKSLFRR